MRKLPFLILIVFCVFGCTSTPLYNIQNVPISSTVTGDTKSIDSVGQAIMNAATKKGWIPVFKKPGLIEANILRRQHRAIIEISYSQTSYSINYIDSINLDFDGENIHRNYNNWIIRLSNEIQKELNKSTKLP